MLKHGFSLGLVPNLLKTGFISSRWPYLGRGEEEEPLDIWKACFAHKPGFYLPRSTCCDKREGEINQSTENMIRVTKLGPKRADLKLSLGFGEGAESPKPPLVLQKSHQPADVTLDIVGGLDHGIWDGIRQNPKSTRRKPHI